MMRARCPFGKATNRMFVRDRADAVSSGGSSRGCRRSGRRNRGRTGRHHGTRSGEAADVGATPNVSGFVKSASLGCAGSSCVHGRPGRGGRPLLVDRDVPLAHDISSPRPDAHPADAAHLERGPVSLRSGTHSRRGFSARPRISSGEVTSSSPRLSPFHRSPRVCGSCPSAADGRSPGGPQGTRTWLALFAQVIREHPRRCGPAIPLQLDACSAKRWARVSRSKT